MVFANSFLRGAKAWLEAAPSVLGPGFCADREWSQHGEDPVLVELLKDQLEDGFYVDVGANHPLRRSNTYRLYCQGMRGILVEPNHELHAQLERVRPGDISLCAGCGPERGEMTFYEFNYHVFSTYAEEEKDRLLKDEHRLGVRLVAEKKTPVLPLGELIEEHRPPGRATFSLLSVDTEGFDEEVLSSNDWDRWRPEIAIVEALGDEEDGGAHRFMESVGYEAFRVCGANTLYREA